VTGRTHVDRMCLCLVSRAFDREMAKRAQYTTSRALDSDYATLLNLRHDCNDCRNMSSSMLLKRSTSFAADVELRATVWC
jgi:hypothetical protein